MKREVASKLKFPKVFGFYLDLLSSMVKGQELPYRYIYSCGGRNSGKTNCMSLFISYLFYYQIPAKIVIFRKKNEGVVDTEKEVINRLRAANIPYEWHKTYHTISNGRTEVSLRYFYNPRTNRKVQKLGFTGNSNFLYEVLWFEEIFEMEEQSVQDAQLSIRGAKHTLTVYTTNPWAPSHWFVKKFTQLLKPNRRTLLKEGCQWTLLPETKSLIHYTNYRVNPAISQDNKEEIESKLERRYVEKPSVVDPDKEDPYKDWKESSPGVLEEPWDVYQNRFQEELGKELDRLIEPQNKKEDKWGREYYKKMHSKYFVKKYKTGRYYAAYFLTDETNLITKAWLGNEMLQRVGLQKQVQVLLLNNETDEVVQGVKSEGFKGNSLFFDRIDEQSYKLWRLPEYDLTYDLDNLEFSYYLALISSYRSS